MPLRINITSVPIDDLDKALTFYTDVLGFEVKNNVPMGEGMAWITVTTAGEPDGTELLLEPDWGHPACKTYKAALVEDGIPWTSFEVPDVADEHERLTTLGVAFTLPPTQMGPVTAAVFDDTCGNLIQIQSPLPSAT